MSYANTYKSLNTNEVHFPPTSPNSMIHNKNHLEIEYILGCKDVWKDSKESGHTKFHINKGIFIVGSLYHMTQC